MPQTARIAYLTALYPAVSHTFILGEVEGLRALGLDVETVSVRRPGPEHLRGAAEKAAADTTFYLLEAARREDHWRMRELALQTYQFSKELGRFTTLRFCLFMKHFTVANNCGKRST